MNFSPNTFADLMTKEIQQNKCLPQIRTEEDFKAASERGFKAAFDHLTQNQKPLADWTLDDLAKIHRLYFADLYPHAGQFRKGGDLASFNGRVGADSPHIPQELNLLLDQVRTLQQKLPSADTPQGVTDRLALIAFAHGRLALVHPFRDGNGRWTRLIVSSLEKQLLPDTGSRTSLPKHIYINALKALPSNMGPLMAYHAEKHGLRPSTLKSVPPPFPVQVTHR